MSNEQEHELLPRLAPGLWPRDLDIELFNIMVDHKPIGISRHFRMVAIYDHLHKKQPNLTSTEIWEHLGKLYNLDVLEEMHDDGTTDPFDDMLPKGKKFADFALPDDDFYDTRQQNIILAEGGTKAAGPGRRGRSAGEKEKGEPATAARKGVKRPGHGRQKRKRVT